MESLEAVMASFVIIAIALSAVCTLLFGAFLTISFTIHREDRMSTVTGHAPSWVCRGARHVAGWHRLRWDQAGARTPVLYR